MQDKKYFIDTNIFLRAIIKNNEKQAQECIAFLLHVESGAIMGAFTSNLILAEIVWTLESFYKIEKALAIKAIHGIIAIPNLALKAQFESFDAISNYKKNNVKFVDALIASNVLIASGQASIVSYDKDFDKLGVSRVEPIALLTKNKPTKA